MDYLADSAENSIEFKKSFSFSFIDDNNNVTNKTTDSTVKYICA